MQLQVMERSVLRMIVDLDPDRAEFVTIETISVRSSGDASMHELISAVRELKRKGFVTFVGGDSLKATETGIAALGSM